MSKFFSPLNRNIAIILSIAMFFVDRFLKTLSLTGYEKDLIPGLLSFGLSKNYNIAFSLFIGGDWIKYLILAIILVLLGIIVLYLKKDREFSMASTLLTIILIGAINNLWDRLKFGFVIDYLNLGNFSVLNISDIMISLGCLLLILTSHGHNFYAQKH